MSPVSSARSRSWGYRCRTPEEWTGRDLRKERKKKGCKRNLKARVAMDLAISDASPVSSNVRSEASCFAGIPATKIPVLQPTTFTLDDVLESVDWTVVQRKKGKKKGMPARRNWSSSTQARRSPASSDGAGGPKKVDQILIRNSNSNYCSLPSFHGYKAHVNFVRDTQLGLGHKATPSCVLLIQTKGTRPRSFCTSRVLGLRRRLQNLPPCVSLAGFVTRTTYLYVGPHGG